MSDKSARIWIRRIGFGFLSLIVLAVLSVFFVILYGEIFEPSSEELTNVSFENDNGVELHGYLAQPEGEGPFPAILLIHEWWGLNEEMIVFADSLADEGYIVLAADARRGEVTNTVPRALWLTLTVPENQIHNDLDRALEYLVNLDQVDPQRVASLGFCFGGGQSLQISLRHPELLAATVMFYGDVVTDPDALRPLVVDQPLLGIFGEEDRSIPANQVREFEEALNDMDVENRILIYEGVGHAFVNAENYEGTGTAAEAWQETLDFLDQHLRNE